jgi:hypothetical protein
MADNRAVVYVEPGKVRVETMAYPKLEISDGPGVNPLNGQEGVLGDPVRTGLGEVSHLQHRTVSRHIADAVNATVISLDEAPQGYSDFDSGVAQKFVLNPHGLITKKAS